MTGRSAAARPASAPQGPERLLHQPAVPRIPAQQYQAIEDNEQRWESYQAEDADVVLVAYGISSRIFGGITELKSQIQPTIVIHSGFGYYVNVINHDNLLKGQLP